MLQRFLGINPGEVKNLLLFSFLGLCWSIASSTGVALSDALFLENVGSHALGYTFALTALGMFGISGVFIYLYNRFEINQIFLQAIYIAILFYTTALSLCLLGVSSPIFFVIFKVCSYFFQVGFLSLFFTFLDQFFELQNAKRVFSILYAPIFLGMAVSGAILGFSSSKLGTLGILILIIGALLTSLWLLNYLSNHVEKIPDDHQEFTVIKTTKKNLFKAIITSPFTLLFLAGCVVLQTILVITEYEYMSGLEKAFQGLPSTHLTAFLGKLYLWGSIVNILFGLLIYGRLVKKMGLNNIILIVPLFFSSLFSLWFFSTTIFLPIMGFIAVEGILNLLEDNNFNLLLNAVPLKLKNKIRITCESLLEPLGMLISSVLLMAFEQKSKILGLGLSLLFLSLTCLMRAYYTKGIFYNLISHLIPFHKKEVQLRQKVSKREFRQSRLLFVEQFYEMKEHEQLFVVESALRFNDMHLLELLLKKMTKLSWQLKLKTLELLEDFPSQITLQYLPYFQFWMKQSPELQNDLFFHLSKLKLLDIQIAQDHLNHTCPKIRGACILAVRQKLPRSFESKKARKLLYQLLISKNEEENLIAIQILKYERLKDFKSKIFELLTHSSERLKPAILKTLAYLLDTHDGQYAPYLLKSLQDPDYAPLRGEIFMVLEKVVDPFHIKELLLRSAHFNPKEKRALYSLILQMGSSALSELDSIFKNVHLPDRVRLMSAQLIGKISHRHLKALFSKLVQEEIHRAYFYYYHLLTLDKGHSGLNSSLLKAALNHSFDSVITLIVQTLAWVNRFEKGEHLVQSLHAKNRKTLSHALETLEKMCSSSLYKQLEPIIEKQGDKEFIKLYHQLQLPTLTIDNLLDYLEQTPSYLNQTLIPLLRQRYQLTNSSFSPSLTPLQNEPNLDHFTLKFLEVC